MRFQCCNKQSVSTTAASVEPREETKRIAGVNVTLSWPSSKDESRGVTFLLPGAMIAISEYNGLRDVILEQSHLVVSLYINVLWPLRNNHRKHAQDAKRVFDELRSMHTSLPNNGYSIVGHSAGAKIALLLASITDPKRVSSILALDPVDITPTEFTNEKGTNLPLNDYDDIVRSEDGENSDILRVELGNQTNNPSKEENDTSPNNQQLISIPIILTYTDGGRGIPPSHNAKAIHSFHPNTTCIHHAHAGHMAYCDHGGGALAGYLMPDVGTKEGNEVASKEAKELIREMLG